MSSPTVRLPVRSKPPARSKRRKRRGGTIAVLVVLALVIGGVWAWWNGSVGPVTIREHCTSVASGKSTELDPDQAGNAAIIAGIANQRGLPARAASIGIATALQESKLRNITYGDRDSLGLFQQRPSQGWGTREQVLDPVYSTNAFFDVLSKVDGFEDMPITDVAQKVQRSAFPDAYADHEPEARIIASALSGYSPGGFTCVLHPAKATAQNPNGDDLTGRAIAVQKAAEAETGQTASVSANTDGTWLRYTVEGQGGEANDVARASWSLAQWAVARASDLTVTRVQVGDQQWQRSSSSDGWTDAADPLPDGQVLVAVA